MNNKYEKLISDLADKRTTFGCMFRDDEGRTLRYAGEPLIPDTWVKLGHPNLYRRCAREDG